MSWLRRLLHRVRGDADDPWGEWIIVMRLESDECLFRYVGPLSEGPDRAGAIMAQLTMAAGRPLLCQYTVVPAAELPLAAARKERTS